jgi:hypothetical protein
MSSAPDTADARAGPPGHPAADDVGSPCRISRAAVQKFSPGPALALGTIRSLPELSRPLGNPLMPAAATRLSRSDLREGADLTGIDVLVRLGPRAEMAKLRSLNTLLKLLRVHTESQNSETLSPPA